MDFIFEIIKRTHTELTHSCLYAPFIQRLINSKVGEVTFELKVKHTLFTPTLKMHEPPSAASKEQCPKVKMTKKKDVPSSSTATPEPSFAPPPSAPNEVVPPLVTKTTFGQLPYAIASLHRIKKTLSTLLSQEDAFDKKADDRFVSLDKRVYSPAHDIKVIKGGNEEDDDGMEVDTEGSFSSSDGDGDQFVVSAYAMRTTSWIERHSPPPFHP